MAINSSGINTEGWLCLGFTILNIEYLVIKACMQYKFIQILNTVR